MFGRIRTKLIGAFLVVVLVPLVGTGLYGNWVTSKTLTEQALEAFQNDLDQRSRGIQSYLGGITNDTLYLSSLPSLGALLDAQQAGDAARMDRWGRETGEDFLRFAASHPSLMQVRYLDQIGREWVRVNAKAEIASPVPSGDLQNKAHRYYFQETMKLDSGQVFVSDLDLNREFGAVQVPYVPVMRYATPISFADGQPGGIVIVNVRAQDILDVVQGEAGDGRILALVNHEGYYLTHPDPGKLWGGPADLGHGYRLGADYPGLEADLLSQEEGFLTLNDPDSPGGLWDRTVAWGQGLILGPERVLGFRSIRPAGWDSETFWVLLRDEPHASTFASVRSFRVTATGVLAGAGLVAFLMAVALARGLAAPILALTQGARRLAEGRLREPVEVKSRDEMGELARAFNEMAVALQQNLERLTLLNQGGQHIAAQMERSEVLAAIIRAVDALIGGDYCVVSLTKESMEEAVVATSSGDDAWLSHRSTPVAMATLQQALDDSTWRTTPLPPEAGPAGYLCCAALCIGLERQGLVEVYGHQEALDDAATGSLLAAVVNQGSIALDKAELIEQLRDHRTELQALVERLIGAQEEERRVVAYDIHDGLIQMLVGVRLQFSNFAARHGAATSEAEAILQRAMDQLGATIAEARRVIEGLRPIALDELGLEDTLHQYAQELAEDTGWSLEFHADRTDLRPPPAVETTAFRIAQEALTNARKHANADQVRVSLSTQNGHLIVEVRDWGQGFDQASVLARSQNVGLAGMRERARLLGGECIIDTLAGDGTSVKVTLPMRVDGNGRG